MLARWIAAKSSTYSRDQSVCIFDSRLPMPRLIGKVSSTRHHDWWTSQTANKEKISPAQTSWAASSKPHEVPFYLLYAAVQMYFAKIVLSALDRAVVDATHAGRFETLILGRPNGDGVWYGCCRCRGCIYSIWIRITGIRRLQPEWQTGKWWLRHLWPSRTKAEWHLGRRVFLLSWLLSRNCLILFLNSCWIFPPEVVMHMTLSSKLGIKDKLHTIRFIFWSESRGALQRRQPFLGPPSSSGSYLPTAHRSYLPDACSAFENAWTMEGKEKTGMLRRMSLSKTIILASLNLDAIREGYSHLNGCPSIHAHCFTACSVAG